MMEREKNDILYLVVPCYNEQEVLPETSKRLKEKMESIMERNLISRDSRIMFVNDGSKDRTWSMIEALARVVVKKTILPNLCRSQAFQKQRASECAAWRTDDCQRVCRYDHFPGCRSAG